MSDHEIAIDVSHVSKSFKLPHEKHSSIKSLFVNIFRRKRSYEKQQVLDDISFQIKKGEFFGIVGRNGSGKSTLLKLLAGIYAPDKGAIGINGKLIPFIELGVGFNMELTGRENVFLNGALLGFDRKEMEAIYDEIVDFAELHGHMDVKIKNYSSGMQVRLAFSIAIRAQTDILLIDEVLAVGDANFQQKCFTYFYDLKEQGKTVIFVSHDMNTVKRFCTQAMLIEDGEIILIDNPEVVGEEYSLRNIKKENLKKNNELKSKSSNKSKKVSLLNVELMDKNNKKTLFLDGNEANIKLDYRLNSEVKALNFGVGIHSEEFGYVFGCNTSIDKVELTKTKNNSGIILVLEKASLLPGNYYINVSCFGEIESDNFDYIPRAISFKVEKSKYSGHKGVAGLNHKWEESK